MLEKTLISKEAFKDILLTSGAVMWETRLCDMSDILLHFQHTEDTCGNLKHEELSSKNEEGGDMPPHCFQTAKQQKCNCWKLDFN